MGLHTPLYETHLSLGARMVPFAGWDMPLHYGSQIEEHHAVRRRAGLFDVSHMAALDLEGTDTRPFLRYLLANDVARLAPGKALYTCMLQEQGGILDDLIVYALGDWYRLVVNAATADRDLAWIQTQTAGFAVQIRRRTDLALLAVQGPKARTTTLPLLPAKLQGPASGLNPFTAVIEGDWCVARTGYTGEGGFELMLPGDAAAAFWQALVAAGVHPCGLGARDTLRLEAGFNLYGTDMDETTTPLESGLAWTIAWTPAERVFIGRAALEAARGRADLPKFVGLLLEGKGILRNHQPVWSGDRQVGDITSGGFAPTLERSIALARLHGEGPYEVEIRGRRAPVRVVKPPFVRHGRPLIELS